MMARHVTKALHIALLAFIEHFLQIVQLHGEHTYIICNIADIMLYGVNGALPTVNITADTLQILHFLFFKSDIRDFETFDETGGPYGGFSAPYGNIEQMSVDEGAERIGEILFSEETEHIVRLLRCLEKYFLPGTSWRLVDRAEVLDAVGELRTVTQNETVRAQAESLLELAARGGGESL